MMSTPVAVTAADRTADPSASPHILVVGSGATGGLFGERLTRAGRDVTFLVRPARARQLRSDGLSVVDGDGRRSVRPTVTTADRIERPADVILLGVKAMSLDAAVRDLAPAVGPDTVIVPLLNGMAHLDLLDDRFGREHVLGGVAFTVSSLDDSGAVVMLAPAASLTVGERDAAAVRTGQWVADALDGAGFDVRTSDDILGAMWAKWSFVATVGALTCLMRSPVGTIVDAGGADLGPAILDEVAAVAEASGHPVERDALDRTRAAVSEPGSGLTSSLYRDLVAGRATEVDHVLGDLVTRAARLGVRTPLLELAALHLRVSDRMRSDAG